MSEQPTTSEDLVGCRDGCGNKVASPQKAGWLFLEITRQYRCPECMRQTEWFHNQQRTDNEANS